MAKTSQAPEGFKLGHELVQTIKPYMDHATTLDLTIVMPTYNVADLLPRLLEKLLAGITHCTFELIMVDDGSSDGTAAVAQAFVDSHPNFYLIRGKRVFAGAARNRAIPLIEGRCVLFIWGQ